MSPLNLKLFVASLCLSLSVACSKGGKTSGGSASGSGTSDFPADTVVASVKGKNITLGELDEKVREQLTNEESEYKQKRHEIRSQGLSRIVNEQLAKDAAEKQGIPVEQYYKTEIEDKAPPPTPEKIKEVYERFSSRMPGSTLESATPQIREFLTQQGRQERAQQVFEKLRKEANVSIRLPRERKQIEPKGPSKGPENAKVTIVEFSDFQCPFCSRAKQTVDQLMQEYDGKVRLYFRHLPLTQIHPEAQKASEASMCAHDQNKFWEYHDLLFANQDKLALPMLKEHATKLGLDAAKFNECLDGNKYAKAVEEDVAAARKLGIGATPAFLINGILVSGAVPLQEFKDHIDAELKGS